MDQFSKGGGNYWDDWATQTSRPASDENGEIQKQEDLTLAGATWDVLKAPFKGVADAGSGIYNLGAATLEMVSGKDFGEIDLWQDTFGFEDTETIVGDFVATGTQFLVPYLGATKVARGIAAGSKFATKAARATQAGKLSEKMVAQGKWRSLARETAIGGAVDFAVFEENEERIIDIAAEAFDLDLGSLRHEEDDSIFEARFKNMLEGAALGSLFDSTVGTFLANRAFRRKMAELGPDADAAARKAQRQLAYREALSAWDANYEKVMARRDELAKKYGEAADAAEVKIPAADAMGVELLGPSARAWQDYLEEARANGWVVNPDGTSARRPPTHEEIIEVEAVPISPDEGLGLPEGQRALPDGVRDVPSEVVDRTPRLGQTLGLPEDPSLRPIELGTDPNRPIQLGTDQPIQLPAYVEKADRMSYKELQAWAKSQGLKANGRKADLVQAYKDANRPPSDPGAPDVTLEGTQSTFDFPEIAEYQQATKEIEAAEAAVTQAEHDETVAQLREKLDELEAKRKGLYDDIAEKVNQGQDFRPAPVTPELPDGVRVEIDPEHNKPTFVLDADAKKKLVDEVVQKGVEDDFAKKGLTGDVSAEELLQALRDTAARTDLPTNPRDLKPGEVLPEDLSRRAANLNAEKAFYEEVENAEVLTRTSETFLKAQNFGDVLDETQLRVSIHEFMTRFENMNLEESQALVDHLATLTKEQLKQSLAEMLAYGNTAQNFADRVSALTDMALRNEDNMGGEALEQLAKNIESFAKFHQHHTETKSIFGYGLRASVGKFRVRAEELLKAGKNACGVKKS